MGRARLTASEQAFPAVPALGLRRRRDHFSARCRQVAIRRLRRRHGHSAGRHDKVSAIVPEAEGTKMLDLRYRFGVGPRLADADWQERGDNCGSRLLVCHPLRRAVGNPPAI